MSKPGEPRAIAIALSGGGYRACLFGLGVLLYVADCGRNAHVASIASVSGGSLANAALGERLDFRGASAGEVEAVVKRVARKIAARVWTPSRAALRAMLCLIAIVAAATLVGVWFTPWSLLAQVVCVAGGIVLVLGLVGLTITGGGPLFGWWGLWAYLALVIACVELVAAGAPRLRDWAPFHDALEGVGVGGWSDSAVLIVAIEIIGLLIAASLLSLRSRVAGRAFAHTLFDKGPKTKLAVLNRTLDHLICATDLHCGHHVYFSGRFTYSYDFGANAEKAVTLPLHEATQASAAFPGAFPPRFVRRRRLGLTSPYRRLVLVDGGVYDNMADQWHRGFSDRQSRLQPHGIDPYEAGELVVVSASAGLGCDPLKRFGVPLLGELFALLRDKSVMYDNGNSLRRQDLVGRFTRGKAHPGGALVHIPQSPLHVPSTYLGDDDADRAKRASDARAALLAVADEATWKAMADANALVPTTLVALSREVTERLLRHAYVLAMVNLHVLLGYPLLKVPADGSFDALLD
jgi:predicted acylesterase/phospholipase RssA